MSELLPQGKCEGFELPAPITHELGAPQSRPLALWGEEEQRNERASAARQKRGIWSFLRQLRTNLGPRKAALWLCGERRSSVMSELLPQGKCEGYGACSDDVTLRLGAWPGRFRCDSSKTRSHFVGPGLLLSLRSKLPYAPIVALRRKIRPRTGL